MQARFAVFIATTLDGFIAREDGRFDFLDPFHGEEHGYAEFFAGVDAVVIGSGTYETVRAFPEWPYGQKRVVVCTRREAKPLHGEQIWAGEPRALAEKLGQEGVRRAYVDGGQLISSFLRDRLVDEMAINIVPILLGKGRPLFGDNFPEQRLRLVETRSFPSGLVQLKYARP
jgi:dihydrofolate reductase